MFEVWYSDPHCVLNYQFYLVTDVAPDGLFPTYSLRSTSFTQYFGLYWARLVHSPTAVHFGDVIFQSINSLAHLAAGWAEQAGQLKVGANSGQRCWACKGCTVLVAIVIAVFTWKKLN